MNFSEAKQYWVDRSRVDERNGKNHYYIAQFFKASGETFFEMRHHQLAIRYDPSDPNIRNDYGLSLLHRKKFDEAEKQFLKAIEIDPSCILALNNLSALYAKQGCVEKAQKYCAKVIQLDPKNAMAHRNMAKLAEECCNTAVALKHNKIAVQIQNSEKYTSREDRIKNASTHKAIARQLIALNQNNDGCAHTHIDQYRALMRERNLLHNRFKTEELVDRIKNHKHYIQ